jgi:hypothetical protein
LPPIVPGLTPAATPPAAASGAQPSVTSLVNLALQQQEQAGGHGGGGHGGGHAKKAGYEAIDDIAARASLNLKRSERSILERQREIDKLREEMAAEDGAVHEREQSEQQHADDDTPEGETDESAS